MNLQLQETLNEINGLREKVEKAKENGQKVSLTESSLDLIEKMARNLHGDFAKGRASIQEAISSTDTDTPWMAALYHTAISHIFPSRYPSSKCVGKDDYDIIKIDNKEYIRFYVPNVPIRRTIRSIDILQ